jgi:hypothetical protein
MRMRSLILIIGVIGQLHAQTSNLAHASIDNDGGLVVVPSATSSEKDFDFLAGSWRSENKRLANRMQNSTEWITGTSRVYNRSLLYGLCNLDRSTTISEGVDFETISLRIFNPQTRLWSSYWVNGNTGVMDPPVVGSFDGDTGTFYGETLWNGKPVLVMYRWNKVNPDKPEWSQSYSSDHGKTWEVNMVNISTRLEDKPRVFEPGVISTDSSEFGSAFSPDGTMFLFARTINKKPGIFISRKLQTGWSIPERVPFSSPAFADADPAFAPDGSLYFVSTRPSFRDDVTSDYDIWKATPLKDGWSEPTNVTALNSPDNEFYISFTASGDAYFSSSRPGGYGEEDVYFSKRTGSVFQMPVNLGNVINTEHSEYDPFISSNGIALVFTSSGRSDSFGKGDLYFSIKEVGSWSETAHFDQRVNTPARDYCSYITADKQQFFFSSDGEIRFFSTLSLPERLLLAIRK